MQKVDYGYNIRGWLKKINNTDELANSTDPVDLFAFKINYDDVEDDLGGQIKKLYNGNISETFWRTASDNTPRKYGYQYDNLNRLTYAIYQKPGMPQTVTNSYNESMQYDKNGNITGLQRNGALDAQGQTIQIDDLIYKYFDNSNQLFTVTDAESNPNGFTDDSTDGDPNNDGQDYYYDANGNMIEDDNKSIDYIQYNHLNLPTEIGISNSDVGTIFYIYDANGKEVQKEVDDDTLGTGNVTDYLDGFQYKDDILQFFPTAEGYVNCNAPTLTPVTLADGSIIQEMVDDIGPTYSYVYNYLDHLGNIRLSYSQDPQTGALRIIEENHYYPFGLKHTNYNSDKNMYTKEMQVLKIKPLPPLFKTSYDFKYGGKELQEELGLNNYDFGARNYDPAIGRWMNIDPLAETSRRFSPYTYALNNPVFFIDPDGMQAQGADGLTDDQWINAHGDVNKQDAYKQENSTQNTAQNSGSDAGSDNNSSNGGTNSDSEGDQQKPKKKKTLDPNSPEQQVKYQKDIQNLNSTFSGVLKKLLFFITLTSGGEIGAEESASVKSTTMVQSGYTVAASKYDYFFGRVVTGSATNIARSAQNLKDLSTLGIKNVAELKTVFNEAIESGIVVSTNTTKYGTSVMRNINVGSRGSINVSFFYEGGNMSATPSVTTIIPKIFK